MREIKFRGYNAKNKEWLYGCYLINRGEHFICPDGIQPPDKTPEDYQVIPDTLGQFTGLKDKHGKEIYEGDIYKNVITGMRYVIEWLNDTSSFISRITGMEYHYWLVRGYFDDMEYVGNIHDNPELLKGGEE